MRVRRARPSGVAWTSGRAGLVLAASLACGCSSTFAERPYRFDVPAPEPTVTQEMARRMSRDTETIPVLVDPGRGVVLSRWKITGVNETLRLWPPGEDRAWVVERWRTVVVPQGWASTVLVDVERAICDADGFRWDAVNLWGRCAVDTSTTRDGQARIDARGAALAAAPP